LGIEGAVGDDHACTKRLKTGAYQLQQQTCFGRTEFFALPGCPRKQGSTADLHNILWSPSLGILKIVFLALSGGL
jgi:hypothetical protein